MTDKPISPLRQRMIDDMTARRIKEKVQKDYVRHVRTFAAFLGRSPDTATSEDLRRFQVHLAQLPIGVATINAACRRPLETRWRLLPRLGSFPSPASER